jgi:hypothetical protein
VRGDRIATVTSPVVADGPAAGCRAVDVRVSGCIDIRILPDRGFDVLGLEQANGSPLGRAHDRAEGRLPELSTGEERLTSVTITAEAR